MNLNKFLTTKKITVAAFARSGGFTIHAVNKWKYGSRIPRPEAMKLIFKLTKGQVSIKDWYPKWD